MNVGCCSNLVPSSFFCCCYCYSTRMLHCTLCVVVPWSFSRSEHCVLCLIFYRDCTSFTYSSKHWILNCMFSINRPALFRCHSPPFLLHSPLSPTLCPQFMYILLMYILLIFPAIEASDRIYIMIYMLQWPYRRGGGRAFYSLVIDNHTR